MVEEVGVNAKEKRYVAALARYMVDHMHCMESEYSVMRLLVERMKRWPKDTRRHGVKAGLRAHKKNRKLYLDVMGGRV